MMTSGIPINLFDERDERRPPQFDEAAVESLFADITHAKPYEDAPLIEAVEIIEEREPPPLPKTPPADAEAAQANRILPELIATRAELRRVEGKLQQTLAEKKDADEQLARHQADFDNFRRRIERERAETYNQTVGELVARLLPVADNLRRALEAERSVEAEESEEFRHFLHGVEMIDKQLAGVLESLGVQPVAALGHPFDPHLHEAVAAEESSDFSPGTVIQEIMRGYTLGGKLLRPAMVKVAK